MTNYEIRKILIALQELNNNTLDVVINELQRIEDEEKHKEKIEKFVDKLLEE